MIQTRCRLLASRLLAILFTRISAISEPSETAGKQIDQIVAFLSTQINFKSGLQRFCFALLVISICGEAAKPSSSSSAAAAGKEFLALMRKSLGERIVKCLDDENTIYFDEIAFMFTRLQKDTRAMLNAYHESFFKPYLGLNLEQTHMSKSVFTFEDVSALAQQLSEKLAGFEAAATALSLAKKKELAKCTVEFKSALLNLTELNKQGLVEQEQLQMRSLFALASSSIDLGCLCERMNPLIRPLIECIRFEANADLQAIASRHLAQLLSLCAKRSPNPVAKIFKNLLNYMCSNDPVRVPNIQAQASIASLPDKDFYECNRFYGVLSDTLSGLNATAEVNGASVASGEYPSTPNKFKRQDFLFFILLAR